MDEGRVVGHLRPDDGQYLVDDLVLDVIEHEQTRFSFIFRHLAVKMARLIIKITQPDAEMREKLRPFYAEDARRHAHRHRADSGD